MAVASVNVDIPYLKAGISVRDWRKEYTAATALLDEKQKVALLPIYVNRNFGDQSWAYQTTEFQSLDESLDFLERNIDGSKSNLVKVTGFFNIQLDVNPQALTRSDLSIYWFKVIDSGREAGLSPDLIIYKFLQNIPHGHKIFEKLNLQIVKIEFSS